MKASWKLVLCMFLVPICMGQDGDKTPIALGKFKMGMINDTARIHKANVKTLETALYSNVRTSLFKTRKFDFLERSGLNSVLEELTRQYDSGVFDPTDRPGWGKLRGAKYMVVGTIVQFGEEERGSKVGKVFGQARKMLVMEVELRIVDVATGKVLYLDKVGTSTALERGTDLGFLQTEQDKGAFDKNESQGTSVGAQVGELTAISTLLQDVASQCVSKVVLVSHPIKVMQYTQNELFLNYGDEVLTVGDVLEICATGKDLVDPDTGEFLAVQPIPIGRARVTEAAHNYSKAKLISGDMDVIKKTPDVFCRPAVKKGGFNPFKKNKQ